MSWVIAIVMALVAFAIAAFVFGLERRSWTVMLAALSLGLAGYALQARPDLPASPRSDEGIGQASEWATVEERHQLIPSRTRSSNDALLIADAFARQGQYDTAATLLRGAVEENPQDAEAWIALGNALVEHADGTLSPAALHAFRSAAQAAPLSPAPGYFLGLALIREGKLLEGREVWQRTLAGSMPGEATGGELGPNTGAVPRDDARAMVAARLERLDTLLLTLGAPDQAATASPAQAP